MLFSKFPVLSSVFQLCCCSVHFVFAMLRSRMVLMSSGGRADRWKHDGLLFNTGGQQTTVPSSGQDAADYQTICINWRSSHSAHLRMVSIYHKTHSHLHLLQRLEKQKNWPQEKNINGKLWGIHEDLLLTVRSMEAKHMKLSTQEEGSWSSYSGRDG